MRILSFTAIALGAGLAFAGANQARADATYTLGVPGTGLSGYTGPYATVDVSLTNSTTATVTFTSLTNGGYVYLMGDGGTADLNISGNFTVGPITETNSYSGFTPNGPQASFTVASANSVGGFGDFNFSLTNHDGFTYSANVVSFVLTAINGNSWANAADVLSANTDGYVAAGHFYACATSATAACNQAEGAATTGFAANGTVAVPSPILGAGLPGLIAGCFGLIALARRRRQQFA